MLVIAGKRDQAVAFGGVGQRSDDEIEALLHPTVAYIEDELESAAQAHLAGRIRLPHGNMRPRWQTEWAASVQPLQSRFGTPDAHNAGLLGYLESVAG